jgi:hypothetical protein
MRSLTAWTRVDADKHDTSDVLAGAALGIASAFSFWSSAAMPLYAGSWAGLSPKKARLLSRPDLFSVRANGIVAAAVCLS